MSYARRLGGIKRARRAGTGYYVRFLSLRAIDSWSIYPGRECAPDHEDFRRVIQHEIASFGAQSQSHVVWKEGLTMSAQIIDGKAIAGKIKAQIRAQVEQMTARGLRRPGLAVIMVGDNPASAVYVRNKRSACDESGIVSVALDLPYSTTQQELLQLIETLNLDSAIDGILVQLPLPRHIEQSAVIEKIDPTKDVDGFHPYNVGRLALRVPLIRPCTPFGVTKLIEHVGVSPKGKHCVVIGASNIVGRPMALELLLMGGTVTVCHRFTGDLEPFTRAADILVVAVGRPGIIRGEWIKPGSLVIDVGMSRMPDGKLCGDVDFEGARKNAAWITPVPGGVGPMTVAMLMKNTLEAARDRIRS
jgi:methylenetetrahydrofolate dehydrogenase (NADP+) / methenyltetrahydrofolate cyclohydrolase